MNWRIRMVEGWQSLHRKSTVRVASAFAALTAFGPSLLDAWNMIPPDLKAALPEGTARWVSTAAFVLLVALRYTKIEKKDANDGNV